MENKLDSLVSEIRSFNRFYTKVLGLLEKHILDSPYSLTEARILLEISKIRDCTANKLISKLDIDRGYMSRVLKSFERDGLVERSGSSGDRRIMLLKLTGKGRSILAELEERSGKQVESLIGHLTESEGQELAISMRNIKNSLLDGINPVVIRAYKAEDVEYIVSRHRELYGIEYGFGPEFSEYVEKYVRKFHEHHDENRESIWIAEAEGKPVGMIALVRVDETTAQLRWFLIEPEMRGRGLGCKLMNTAMDFSREKGYSHVFLWTVSILEAARTLYKRFGFRLTESKPNDSWGVELLEERWDMYM